MTEFTVVDISWSDRIKIHYDPNEQVHGLPEADGFQRTGFYCLYGRHPVYGPDVLLYIGETKMSATGRSFRARLGEHLKGRFWYHANLSVSLGTLEEGQQLTAQAIRAVESVLIAAHKPALNRRHIDCALPGAEQYLIRNWEFPGALQHECSGYYWR